MADFIARLKVDSQEYDNKIKNAVQGLQHLERSARDAGKSLNDASKEQVEYVRSLGNMETKATSARGKLSELTKGYTELSMQYRRMTDEEKRGDYGKALGQSLDQLKGRINGLKGDLKDVTSELGDGGGGGLSGVLDAVAGKLGVPVEMFTKLGAAAAGIGAALKVATDALKQNEEFMDEWGRITESATAIYDGFLNALNTGNFSAFFSNMDGIVQSAREAYDALDDLGTFQAFNQINELKARAGMDNAIAAYREGTGSKEAVRSAGANMIAQLEQRLDLQNTAYRKKIEELANTRDVDIELLTKALSGEYGDYAALKELSMPTKSVWNSSTRTFNDVIDYGAATEEQKLGEMLRKFTDDELNALQKLGADAANTEVQIAGVNKQLSRILKTDGIIDADKVLPAGSIAEVKARIAELNKDLEKAADQTTRDKIRIQIEDLKRELEMMSTPMTGLGQVIPLEVELLDTSKEKLAADMEELRKRLGLEPIKLGVEVDGKGSGTVDAAKQAEKAWGAAANAISAIGGALQQIEDPSAKVAGIIMQAVANIALGFATATTQAAAGGPFAWIAATVAGIANMISAVTAIKQVTSSGKGFANGGIVPGNSFSGDNLHTSDYGINSGELILNRSQQNVIASQLQGGAAQNMRLEALISGESLRMVLANNASRRGGNRAQYAISKFG